MENSQQLTPICAYNKQVYQVCINPKCMQVCFICGDNKCQCKLLHKKCDKVDWDYIYDNLDKNIIKNTQEFKSLFNTLDQLYQTAIKDITKCYDDFKIWRDDFGLTETQSSFLHLIEEGKFTELTSIKMYQIRKEIRTPSKIIIKSYNQLKQEAGLINEYTEKLIEQLKGLYSGNKVIKEESEDYNENKGDKIKIVENIQSKANLAHKLLGLNQNGSRFFTMINEGVIEKQLQKILEKINLNEQSINENKKVTNQTINNIKQAMELKIEKLTETVAKNADSLKIEMKQQIKQIKQDINNFQKNILEVDKKIKISNHKSMSTQKFSAFDTKIKNLKAQIIQKQLEIQSKELKLFPEYFLEAQFKLKNEFLKKFEALQIKNSKLLNQQVKDDIPSSNLVEQLTKLQKQASDIQQQMKMKINQMPSQTQSIKIQCISKFFTKKLKKLNLLYRASENNFQASKFWDKCQGKTNTITILKTQFGNIIGGYTPLAWNKSINGNQQDTTKQTFLFSITQKHKIPISRNQQYAVYHYATYGPSFGGCNDLYICDKANVTGSSQGIIGYTYNNGQYTYGSQQGYKKWCGQSSGYQFFIQQWEVYEITFE